MMQPWRSFPIFPLLATMTAWCFLSACTTVASISVSQIPVQSQRGTPIRSHDWSPIILFIPFGSGFVDQARTELLAQCPNGSVEGTLAKFEDINYFLGLYKTQNVTMEAYCVRGISEVDKKQNNARRKRRRT